MRFRLLGFGLLLAATLGTTGCFCCWPCCRHRCCFASPVPAGGSLAAPAPALAAPGPAGP